MADVMMTVYRVRRLYLAMLALIPLAWYLPVESAQEMKHGQHGVPGHHAQPKQQGVVSLDIYRDGARLHLLTMEVDARRDARQLLYRQSVDDGKTWSKPISVHHDSVAIYAMTRGNDAQIAASGQRVLVAWTAKGNGWERSGPLATAVSVDGGKTWRAGGNPADDNATNGHAYTELIAANGSFDAVWLDGRDGAQGLRHARSRDGFTWEKNTTVQGKTCECCWQSLTRNQDALFVLFRGKDPRDMLLSALPQGTANWGPRGRVGRFDWDFKGCPHTGGGLATTQGQKSLHAVVWTGATAAQGLHHLSSRDGGATWNQKTMRLGSPDARHADIVAANDGRLVATWDQLEGSRRLIYVAHSLDDGENWSVPRRISAADVDAVYPRVASAGRGFLVLWTESKTDGLNVMKTAAYHAQRPAGQ